MKKKISIIIPNYNHKPYLQQRLDTVFNQTYQNFEVILLDDASTDGSQAILKQYQNHPKVSHLIINSQNSGSPFKQWQKGINVAKGEWIWIAESDDSNDITFLERCHHVLQTEKNIRLVATGLLIFSEHTKEIFTATKNGVYKGTEFIQDKMIKGNSLRNASSVVFYKKAISDVTLNNITKFKICGDWFLWLTILKGYNLSYIQNPLTNYRKHHSATTSNLNNNTLFYHEVFILLNEVKKWKIYENSHIDNALFFWIKKLHKSNIPSKKAKQIEKKYVSILTIKGKIAHYKKKIISFVPN